MSTPSQSGYLAAGASKTDGPKEASTDSWQSLGAVWHPSSGVPEPDPPDLTAQDLEQAKKVRLCRDS